MPLPCPCGCEDSWVSTDDSSPTHRARAQLATDMAEVSIPLVATGEPALDELLDGGFAVGSVVFLYGRRGSGKSRLAYRWATRAPALIVHTELSALVARTIVESSGGVLSQSYLLGSLDGWRAEAERLCVRSVVVDSLASSKSATATVLALRSWAQASGGIAYAIQHANKRGDARGTTSAPHWADYELRTSKPTPTAKTTRVEILKTRIGPTGIVSVGLI